MRLTCGAVFFLSAVKRAKTTENGPTPPASRLDIQNKLNRAFLQRWVRKQKKQQLAHTKQIGVLKASGKCCMRCGLTERFRLRLCFARNLTWDVRSHMSAKVGFMFHHRSVFSHRARKSWSTEFSNTCARTNVRHRQSSEHCLDGQHHHQVGTPDVLRVFCVSYWSTAAIVRQCKLCFWSDIRELSSETARRRSVIARNQHWLVKQLECFDPPFKIT